jgi:hypothetical protein
MGALKIWNGTALETVGSPVVGDSGIQSASGSFTGSARFTKFSNGLVLVWAEIDRASGSSTVFTTVGISPPAGFIPVTNVIFQASTEWNGNSQYQFRVNNSGTLDIRQTAVITTTMALSGQYYV